MANNQRHLSLFLVLFSCLTCCSYAYNQLVVGGKDGWVPNPSESYNHWAERMRFQINDSLLFKYNNLVDSVLVVNKGDYDSCNTGNPLQKFTDGNSVITFDRSGPFYFISGNKTNCDGGQKMIVVVIAARNPPTVTPPSPSPPSPSPTTGAPSPSSPSPASGGTSPSTSPSPATGAPSPSSPSPASGGTSPSTSPSPATGAPSPSTSPSPASEGPSSANSPSSLSPGSGGPSSANSPSSSSSSPAGTPSGSSTSPGSLAPGSGGSSTTPADGGSPPPGRSFAVPSCGPSGVLVLLVSIVLSVAFGGFIN